MWRALALLAAAAVVAAVWVPIRYAVAPTFDEYADAAATNVVQLEELLTSDANVQNLSTGLEHGAGSIACPEDDRPLDADDKWCTHVFTMTMDLLHDTTVLANLRSEIRVVPDPDAAAAPGALGWRMRTRVIEQDPRLKVSVRTFAPPLIDGPAEWPPTEQWRFQTFVDVVSGQGEPTGEFWQITPAWGATPESNEWAIVPLDRLVRSPYGSPPDRQTFPSPALSGVPQLVSTFIHPFLPAPPPQTAGLRYRWAARGMLPLVGTPVGGVSCDWFHTNALEYSLDATLACGMHVVSGGTDMGSSRSRTELGLSRTWAGRAW